MGRIILESKKKTVKEKGVNYVYMFMDNQEFDKFSPEVLGLGDIASRSTRVEAIAAAFDLSGFTDFCNQVDPHLAIPDYLSSFLDWLFYEVKNLSVSKSYKKGKTLWTKLPFLAKFTGDGVLFLWDSDGMWEEAICNVVVTLWNICNHYKTTFYPRIKQRVVQPPSSLRCGIARGMVCSVGNGEDYVGPCINIASRLQKLSVLTFCVSKRGFDFGKYMTEETAKKYVAKRVPIRGIGQHELVWVRKTEFENLSPREKKLFKEP